MKTKSKREQQFNLCDTSLAQADHNQISTQEDIATKVHHDCAFA